jgi:hypothetical protein
MTLSVLCSVMMRVDLVSASSMIGVTPVSALSDGIALRLRGICVTRFTTASEKVGTLQKATF